MTKEINRAEFLQLTKMVGAGILFSRLPWNLNEIDEIKDSAEKIDPLFQATSLSMLEYHDPKFNANDVCMTPKVFEAQLDWLKTGNYYTPTATEIFNFLKGKATLPNPSVALRFDLGIDKINKEKKRSEWLDVFKNLEKRGQHALIFLIHSTIESEKNGLKWEDIAYYVNKGVISPCSHGLKDHPNYKLITKDYAVKSMRESREEIIRKLKKAGVRKPEVLAFAFPYDAVPNNAQELVEKAGYLFHASGAIKNGNNFIDYNALNQPDNNKPKGIPCIYPYVYKRELESIKREQHTLLPLLGIKGGLNFIKTLEVNSNNIFLNKDWEKAEIYFTKNIMLLPEKEITTKRLINPKLIIVHTDSQHEESFPNWNTKHTFYGLNGKNRKILVTFGVDKDKITQFTHIYRASDRKGENVRLWIPEPSKNHEGAKGVPSAINIEMSGINYDKWLEKRDSEQYKFIMETIHNTANLIYKIINNSGGQLSLEDVVGHYEATIRGKTDPGEKTMQILREQIKKLFQNNILSKRKDINIK